MPAVTITLREITETNVDSVLEVRTTSDQERFVSTVADSIAEAAANPQGNPWYRAVYADKQPVGFVMLSWDVEPQPPQMNGPWFLWKLLIDSQHQGLGYGQEVMRQVVKLVRGQGATELLTSYVPGEGGPSGFYARLGFVPRGDVDPDGEVILRLDLHRVTGALVGSRCRPSRLSVKRARTTPRLSAGWGSGEAERTSPRLALIYRCTDSAISPGPLPWPFGRGCRAMAG